MKKLLAAALTVCMTAAAAFSINVYAASAEADVTGEWYLASMQEGEEVIDASYLSMMGITAVATLQEDGTFTLDLGGDVSEGTWTFENGAGQVVVDEEPVNITLSEGNLVMSAEDTAEVMIFSREMPEIKSTEVGAVIADPQLADFNGTWEATEVFFFGMTLPISVIGEEISMEIQDGTIAYHHVGTPLEDGTEEETAEAAEETEPALVVDDFTFQAELVDGALVVKDTGDAAGTVNPLSLKLHENGILTDGYTEPEVEESAEAAEAETEEAEEFDMRYFIIFEKAEKAE